jgi:ABC-2 type transport system ATP-binding protein
MKQKLAVARSMINRPSLLFLDEPTAGLDPVAAAGLRDILEQLVSDEGMTVFLTTHNLSEAEKLCSSVGVINRGRLVTVGPPGNLISVDGTEHAEIRCGKVSEAVTARLQAMHGVRRVRSDTAGYDIEIEPSASLAPLIRLLVDAGVDVEEARREKTSLEDAFLTLMKEEE